MTDDKKVVIVTTSGCNNETIFLIQLLGKVADIRWLNNYRYDEEQHGHSMAKSTLKESD